MSAARITEEVAGYDDREHTSEGDLVAINSNLGAAMGADEGSIELIPRNEGRIAQAWVNERRAAYLLCVLLAFRWVVVKKWGFTGSSSEKNSDHKASMADSV